MCGSCYYCADYKMHYMDVLRKKIMENNKEVYFDKYCQSCKHNNTKEYKDPCNDCLAEPNNINSHRPIRYENKNKK